MKGSSSDETERMVGGQPHYGTFQATAPPYPQQPVMGIPQPVPPPGAPGSEGYYPPGYQSVPGYPSYPPPPPPPSERPHEVRLPCCGLGIGWLLFIIGFIFASIPWYVGAFLLFCCRQDRREKPGLVACTIAVKEGFFKCIDRMYDPETAAKVRIEWTKFATLRGYRQAAKADIKTMAQEDPILWWSAYGPKSTTTTLAIRLLSQVSSSSASERNWSTYSFIHSLKRNRLTSQRAEKLVAVHSVLRINDRTTSVYKESPASRWDVEPEEPSQIDEEDALDPTTGLVGVPFSALDLGETDSSSGDEFQPPGDDH